MRHRPTLEFDQLADLVVLLTDGASAEPVADSRARMAEVMFEGLGVGGFSVACHAKTAAASQGWDTATVVDIGFEVTDAALVYEGYMLPHAVSRADVGGHHVTEFMRFKLLPAALVDAPENAATVRAFKEQHARVALDLAAERGAVPVQHLQLPDGTSVPAGPDLLAGPECLFQPSMHGLEGVPGIHELAHAALSKVDAADAPAFYGRILLAGGSAALPNLARRFEHELARLAPAGIKLDVQVARDAAWTGGAMLARLSTFASTTVTRADYNEHGPGLINKRCF